MSTTLTSNKQRATLLEDASLFLQSELPLSETVSLLGNKRLIGIVNSGIDDFSVVRDNTSLSLIMAAKFFAITEAMKTMESFHFRVTSGNILKNRSLYKDLQEDLGDVLYIYRKLKSQPRGLNLSVLNAYQARYPDANIPDLLKQMDTYSFRKTKGLRTHPVVSKYRERNV